MIRTIDTRELTSDAQKQIVVESLAVMDLLLKKNSNYGASVFEPPVLANGVDALTAIQVRMSDKIKRFQTLIKGEPDKVGESLTDTMRDFAGYAILWLTVKQLNLVQPAANGDFGNE